MHKKLLVLILLLMVFQTRAQEKLGKPFITGDINFTLAINPNYEFFDETSDETLLELSAFFLRFGFGYEFKKRVAISVNGGYDVHWLNDVDAFPMYMGFKYNISEKDDDAFFTEFRLGQLFTLSNRYPDGNYFAVGFGWQIAGEERWNTIIRLDFHRKGILGFKNNRLDSVSFGIGFSFF